MSCPYATIVRRRTLLLLNLTAADVDDQIQRCPPVDLEAEIERYYAACEAKGRGSKNIFESVARQAGRGDPKEPSWQPFGPPRRSCEALPGSQERILEYRRRLELGRDMWHESDNNGDG